MDERQELYNALAELIDDVGIEAVRTAVELAPMLRDIDEHGKETISVACTALKQGIDGCLVFQVPGVPGRPPKIGWGSGTYEVTMLPQRSFA